MESPREKTTGGSKIIREREHLASDVRHMCVLRKKGRRKERGKEGGFAGSLWKCARQGEAVTLAGKKRHIKAESGKRPVGRRIGKKILKQELLAQSRQKNRGTAFDDAVEQAFLSVGVKNRATSGRKAEREPAKNAAGPEHDATLLEQRKRGKK